MNRINVLITGAASPIGERLIRVMLADSRVNRILAVSGTAPEALPLPSEPRLERVQVDIRRTRRVRHLLFGPARDMAIDVVVHLAADASPSADFYGSLLDRNIKSTYNAFHAAREAGCSRVVYASSVNAVLGYEGVGRDGEASGSAWDVPTSLSPLLRYGLWCEQFSAVFCRRSYIH